MNDDNDNSAIFRERKRKRENKKKRKRISKTGKRTEAKCKRTDRASRANPHICRSAARWARAAYSCSPSTGKRSLLRPITGTL